MLVVAFAIIFVVYVATFIALMAIVLPSGAMYMDSMDGDGNEED